MNDSLLVAGIDLGTTYSLVAVWERGAPRLLRSPLGGVLTPSAVAVEGDTVLIGQAALDRMTTAPERSAAAFKRDMGTGATYSLGGRSYTPVELSALVLRHLAEEAETLLGRGIDEAVISVPAYFNDPQRKATREAAELAGLNVERLINEPTAAAIAYGLNQREREERAAVLDLGGGTFDVTVLEIIEGVIEIQSTAGDSRLGGEDFTRVLAEEVCRLAGLGRLGEEPGHASWRRLARACEEAKRLLSRQESAEVRASGLELPGGGRHDVRETLTRERAEQLWAPLLERIERPIRRALNDAGLGAGEVEQVLLVGGASRTPAFVALAERLFGRPPLRDLPADEVVALGAAVQAGLKAGDTALEDLIVTDVAPFSLGVEVSNRIGTQRVDGIFSPILDRGTVIPASRVQTYHPMTDQQTEILLSVFQGEHPVCARNLRLGQLRVPGIPPNLAGEEEVEVRFTYDLDGVLEVEARVLSTGVKHQLVLEQSPGRLSGEELEAARERMQKLKFHPRDALPNTAALAAAEALYVELTGDRRDLLGEAIAYFRGVLESQDPEQIASCRESLVVRTRALKAELRA